MRLGIRLGKPPEKRGREELIRYFVDYYRRQGLSDEDVLRKIQRDFHDVVALPPRPTTEGGSPMNANSKPNLSTAERG